MVCLCKAGPYIFRKVLMRSSKFVKDIMITQSPQDGTIEWAFSIHLFGTTVNQQILGKKLTMDNLWHKPVTSVLAPFSSEGVSYQWTDHPGCPEGTVDDSLWELDESGDKLLWHSKVYRPDLDQTTVYTQHFLRQKEKRRKGKK